MLLLRPLLRHFPQGFGYPDLLDRFFANPMFSSTDVFAIVSHYAFLIGSANTIFLFNLSLPRELTDLNGVIRELSLAIAASNHDSNVPKPPSVRRMMIYRLSVCFTCTLASVVFFSAIHSVVRNPELTYLDPIIIVVIVFALYCENQNHMFSELLFLRYLNVLDAEARRQLAHFGRVHPAGRGCCFERSRILRQMYAAIDKTFGNDLLVTVVILVISLVFGLYLLLTFLFFIKGGSEKLPFVVAYFLYSVIPVIR